MVVFSQRLPEEAASAARLLGLEPKEALRLQNLPRGHAFIRSPLYDQPVQAVFPHIDWGQKMSEGELDGIRRRVLADLEPHVTFSEPVAIGAEPVNYWELLGENDPPKPENDPACVEEPSGESDQSPLPGFVQEWADFLSAVERAGRQGSVIVYATAGMSRSKGTKIKKTLLKQGLLEVQRMPSPRGGRPKEGSPPHALGIDLS